MIDPDDRLRALFAADLPPARDPAFQAEILAALARRRFLEEMALLAMASLGGAITLAVLWPVLGASLASISQALTPAAIALAVAVSILGLAWGNEPHGSEADVGRG